MSGPINIATKQVNVGNLIREKELELNSLINTRNQIMAEIAGRNKRNMHELDKLDPNISTLEREIQ